MLLRICIIKNESTVPITRLWWHGRIVPTENTFQMLIGDFVNGGGINGALNLSLETDWTQGGQAEEDAREATFFVGKCRLNIFTFQFFLLYKSLYNKTIYDKHTYSFARYFVGAKFYDL